MTHRPPVYTTTHTYKPSYKSTPSSYCTAVPARDNNNNQILGRPVRDKFRGLDWPTAVDALVRFSYGEDTALDSEETFGVGRADESGVFGQVVSTQNSTRVLR